MKILFLSHKFYPDLGGIEVNSEILANGFKAAGHEVKLVTTTAEKGTKSFSYEVIRQPGFKKLFALHQWADVVYENNPCLRMSWPAIFTNKPNVVALRTWIARNNGTMGLQDILKKIWLKRAAGVIAVSEAVKNRSFKNSVIIGNPYRDQLFVNDSPDQKKDEFVFLGRIVSDKGIDIALKAINLLKKQNKIYDNVKFTIIGKGEDQNRLVALTKDLELEKNVEFAGALTGSELVSCLNRHRFILVPSKWEEPFGNVALEGMACGCIPIVSDGGGLPDAVGKAGITFKRNDEIDLANKIRMVFENSEWQKELREQSVVHLAEHTPRKVVQKYLAVIHKSSGQE